MSSSTTQTTICNQALRLIGAKKITIITQAVEEARVLNDIWTDMLDEVLASHPWNFAIKRASLTALGGLVTTWTAEGTTNVWQAALTTEPASVKFNGTTGTEQTSAAACTAANYWFWESNILYVYSASDPDTAYTNPGINAVIPEFEYAYAYSLPSDCLRLIRMEESDSDFVREEARILTDESVCKIQYIARITDTTLYTPGFITAFAARLAAEIAYPLTNSAALVETMDKLYEKKLKRAKGMDAQEGVGQKQEDLSWEEARE
uniref:Putative tail tubular protein n=1 Tax=viral metagenome TaxID=1070528 RepID=A0A6M3IYR8_9ZZZZ